MCDIRNIRSDWRVSNYLGGNVRETDFIVVGLGPAGESVGAQLAKGGKRVIGIEASLVGGECPYWGCVPSKMAIRAANSLMESQRVNELAGSATATPDWAPVAKRIREQATDNWNDQVAVDRFTDAGGEFIRGRATIVGPGKVEVNGEEITASEGIILSTGTMAAVPPIEGLADTPYWTNHHIIETEVVPESLIVLGGGPIGLEMAQVMNRFGADVKVVEGTDRLLPRNEPEASAVVKQAFEAEGIAVHLGQFASSVTYDDDSFTVTLADGTKVTGEKLLVATGRDRLLKQLGVDALGIDSSTTRALTVRPDQKVQDGLWAVGDVTDTGLFTHIAVRQANIAAAAILGNDFEPINTEAISAVTFTDPEVGSVGLTEAEAKEKSLNVSTAVKEVGHTARGWLHSAGNEGVIKLVVDNDSNTLVGATSAGPHGGEVLGLLSLAVHAKTPISQLKSMIYAYPTFHRGIEDTLGDL